MKLMNTLVLVLVLTATLLTGCGRNKKPMDTMPSENTTAPTTMATTAPTTEATTMPTTRPTTENTEATIDNGNGPMPSEETEGSDTAGNNAKARQAPRMK